MWNLQKGFSSDWSQVCCILQLLIGPSCESVALNKHSNVHLMRFGNCYFPITSLILILPILIQLKHYLVFLQIYNAPSTLTDVCCTCHPFQSMSTPLQIERQADRSALEWHKVLTCSSSWLQRYKTNERPNDQVTRMEWKNRCTHSSSHNYQHDDNQQQ